MDSARFGPSAESSTKRPRSSSTGIMCAYVLSVTTLMPGGASGASVLHAHRALAHFLSIEKFKVPRFGRVTGHVVTVRPGNRVVSREARNGRRPRFKTSRLGNIHFLPSQVAEMGPAGSSQIPVTSGALR